MPTRDFIVTVMAQDRVGIVRAESELSQAVQECGGLFGESPILAVPNHTSDAFVSLGGRIPAPLTSLNN